MGVRSKFMMGVSPPSSPCAHSDMWLTFIVFDELQILEMPLFETVESCLPIKSGNVFRRMTRTQPEIFVSPQLVVPSRAEVLDHPVGLGPILPADHLVHPVAELLHRVHRIRQPIVAEVRVDVGCEMLHL